MFTGIVRCVGTIARHERARGDDASVRLAVEPAASLGLLAPGDSVSVDGVCLTVVRLAGRALEFDVVPETLRRTTLGARRAGDRVNLEPALRAGDPLGGHWVQGHVEGVGRLHALDRRGDEVRWSVHVPEALADAVVPKGSVTLDGVSLTVGEVGRAAGGAEGEFAVYLVPHTLAVTTFGSRKPGDGLNVEPDLLGRWVEHHVRALLGREEQAPGTRSA